MSLTFYENGFADLMRLNWPASSPRLQAYLATDTNVSAVNTEFIIANTPIDHRIYFVTGSPLHNEHENTRAMLHSLGEAFEERVETRFRTAGIIKRHKIERNVEFILGSTKNKETIEGLFGSYMSWYGMSWPFVFIISKEEPASWKNLVEILTSGKGIPERVIMQSHCILQTRFEHGILIASREISRQQIVDRAKWVADRLSTPIRL